MHGTLNMHQDINLTVLFKKRNSLRPFQYKLSSAFVGVKGPP